MSTQSYYEGINHVIHVSTNIGAGCEHCDISIGLEKFAASINHYIEQHGYKLLHVGAETTDDLSGHPWHGSDAVLGR